MIPARRPCRRLPRLRYRPVDFADPRTVAERGRRRPRRLRGRGRDAEPVAAYLALPAGVFPAAVTALGVIGLPPGSRIALEKPFGEDLGSAMALNALLARVAGVAGEHAVFRVDHALGMATVQNLLGVRLANRVWEPLWNSLHIEQVDLLWEEDLALEGRAGYYDRTGALKDVIQNHLLQVLCLVAMEPPNSIGERDLRDRKLDVLRAVRPLTRRTSRLGPAGRATPRAGSASVRSRATPRRAASIPSAARRPSPRSCSSSTAGGGRAHVSCFAPARPCNGAAKSSWCASGRSPTCPSPRDEPRRPAASYGSAWTDPYDLTLNLTGVASRAAACTGAAHADRPAARDGAPGLQPRSAGRAGRRQHALDPW